jgi:hypothetical protein
MGILGPVPGMESGESAEFVSDGSDLLQPSNVPAKRPVPTKPSCRKNWRRFRNATSGVTDRSGKYHSGRWIMFAIRRYRF